ncbi:unnamed protein product, partial [Acanthocheilonema viteae]
VITDLELERCINSRIGVSGTGKGITSGEAKRLSFATEILTNPSLLFADEPTTGIDSFMAYHIVKVLERMASENGKTIICTIHQPASDTFEMFDRVVFLANGKIAFLGSPSEALRFYADVGYSIPAHTNPADFFIQTLAIVPGDEEKCIERANQIINAFMKSKYEVRMREYLELGNKHFQAQLTERAKASIPILIYALFIRSFKQNLRNPTFLWAKLVQKIVMGLFLGTLYLRTEMNQDGVINIRGALFYYISELTYSTIFGIQTFLPADFPLLVREYHDGIYPVICYYLSTVSPSYPIAISITGPLLTLLSITGGLYSNVRTIHESVRWVQYFSWFRFGYESLIINEFFHYDNISCLLSNGQPAAICEDSGKSVINNLNFDINNIHINMGVMLFYVLCVFIIGYIGLVLRVQLAR